LPRTSTPVAVPSFDDAPSVILVAGDVEFFVEEEARKAGEKLAEGGAEFLRFDDEASAAAVSDALLNRSLFSPRRVVCLDVTRLLGTDAPGKLLDQALEGWERGGVAGRRQAFRAVRAVFSALGLPPAGTPEERAEIVAKRLRRRDGAEALTEILRELPEEKETSAVLLGALRSLLGRPNDGIVALLTATSPPQGAGFAGDVERKGLLLRASVGEDASGALTRLANSRAKEREVAVDPDAVERLISRTGENPALFASELNRLLQWAGPGGRVRREDVGESVEDESSEDLFELYEDIGRRDAAQALLRLERIFSGREVRSGDQLLDVDEYALPVVVLGRVTDELRRMMLVRTALEAADLASSDAVRNMGSFKSRIYPALERRVEPFGRSPFSGSPFRWFHVARRGSRFTTEELARALVRAPEVDVKLKNSAPPLETLTDYVAGLIAGKS
jgi:hypothetical protein